VSWARKPRIESLEQRRLLSTIRTIVYNQITSQPATDPLARDENFNTLSADGTRAVFSTADTPIGIRVYSVDAKCPRPGSSFQRLLPSWFFSQDFVRS
jgi:hypothetical protein